MARITASLAFFDELKIAHCVNFTLFDELKITQCIEQSKLNYFTGDQRSYRSISRFHPIRGKDP